MNKNCGYVSKKWFSFTFTLDRGCLLDGFSFYVAHGWREPRSLISWRHSKQGCGYGSGCFSRIRIRFYKWCTDPVWISSFEILLILGRIQIHFFRGSNPDPVFFEGLIRIFLEARIRICSQSDEMPSTDQITEFAQIFKSEPREYLNNREYSRTQLLC